MEEEQQTRRRADVADVLDGLSVVVDFGGAACSRGADVSAGLVGRVTGGIVDFAGRAAGSIIDAGATAASVTGDVIGAVIDKSGDAVGHVIGLPADPILAVVLPFPPVPGWLGPTFTYSIALAGAAVLVSLWRHKHDPVAAF